MSDHSDSFHKSEEDVPPKVDPEAQADFDAEFEKHTIRKVDRRLLLILGALYSFSLIDRGNLAVARAVGADAALGLSIGSRYSIVSLVFFIPYIVFELPSNILIRKIGTRYWLASIGVAWGIIQIGMGFLKNWKQLVACRVLLGLLEAGFFPGCTYLISVWYTRQEVQKRLAAFFLVSVLVGGFANILAYGFYLMGGLQGIAGWQWIFIMCGIITLAIAFPSFFLIVDFPDKNTFLTPAETKVIITRVEKDRGDSVPDPLTWAKVLTYSKDLKIWAFAFMYLGTTMPAYAFGYFLPAIIGAMGYNTEDILLLNAPPYGAACVFSFTMAYLADKYNKRGIFIVIQAAICVCGLSMTAFATSHAVKYAGAFLGMCGCEANIPAILAYQSNNIVGQSKRAFSSAIVVGFGGIGGIVATTSFRQKDAPGYRPGLWTSIGCQLMIISIVGVCSVVFRWRNAGVRSGKGGLIEGREGFLYTL